VWHEGQDRIAGKINNAAVIGGALFDSIRFDSMRRADISFASRRINAHLL